MNVDGTAVTQLTNNASVDDRDPSWSPDGKQLVFVSFRDGDPEIFVMNADGTGVTQLANDVFSDFLPVWTRRLMQALGARTSGGPPPEHLTAT